MDPIGVAKALATQRVEEEAANRAQSVEIQDTPPGGILLEDLLEDDPSDVSASDEPDGTARPRPALDTPAQ